MRALPGTDLFSIIATVVLGLAWCVFMLHRAHRQHPAFCAYLSCRLGAYGMIILAQRAAGAGLIDSDVLKTIHYYTYLVGYLAGAGLAFLVIQSVFSRLIEPFPGLHRFGMVAFRWATATSVLIALASAVLPAALNADVLVDVTVAVTRCMSILKLCLLAFILFSMQSLRFSPKSRDFGIAVGMAMIAAGDLAASAYGHSSAASMANYASQIGMTLAAGVWVVYFLRATAQEPRVRVSQSSALNKWNEVAAALTEPPPQIALGAPSNTFFLHDVEKAVDKVMERNSMKPQN